MHGCKVCGNSDAYMTHLKIPWEKHVRAVGLLCHACMTRMNRQVDGLIHTEYFRMIKET